MKEKTIYDLIELWSPWKPDLDYVCPSSVAYYYWKCYMASEKRGKPLFPFSELNDVAAVFANSKPAAIAKINPDDMLLREFALACKKYHINSRFFKDNLIFCKRNILNSIEEAMEENDAYILGIALGYPEEAIKEFMAKRRNVKIAGNKTILDENYIKSLKIPNFKPSDDWFV